VPIRSQALRLLVLGLVALAAASVAGAQSDGRRPNVVWLVADDLGYGEVACYGGPVPTPRIDALARSGMLYTQAYCLSPTCSPSRAGLLTGRPPQCAGFEFNPGSVTVSAGEGRGLEANQPGIARSLRELGYRTACIGKWHLGPLAASHPLEQGFDEFFGFLGPSHAYVPGTGEEANQTNPILRGREPWDEPEYLTDALAREAVDFLERSRERPFFLYVAFNAVHRPYQEPERTRGRFPKLPKDAQTRAGMLVALDEGIGRILDALHELDLERDTFVCFTSDNGAAPEVGANGGLRLGKQTLFEGGLRIPMVLAWPGRITAGARVDVPVSHLDLGMTALVLGGADERVLAGFDGFDLFDARAPFGTRTLLWRVGPSAALRCGDFKLVASNDSRWLFDVAHDPEERKDLRSELPELAAEFDRELQAALPTLPEPSWDRDYGGMEEDVLGQPYWVVK